MQDLHSLPSEEHKLCDTSEASSLLSLCFGSSESDVVKVTRYVRKSTTADLH